MEQAGQETYLGANCRESREIYRAKIETQGKNKMKMMKAGGDTGFTKSVWPCVVFRMVLGITKLYTICGMWVHKRCSAFRGMLQNVAV